jgi:hypothetical protein
MELPMGFKIVWATLWPAAAAGLIFDKLGRVRKKAARSIFAAGPMQPAQIRRSPQRMQSRVGPATLDIAATNSEIDQIRR